MAMLRRRGSRDTFLGSFRHECGGWGSTVSSGGKSGFKFRVVLPSLIRNYCHFIIISRCGNGFVVMLKRKKMESLS